MIIVGIGKNKNKAKETIKGMQKYGKAYLGVGITKQWDTEYCAVVYNIPLWLGEYFRRTWGEECIISGINGHGELFYGHNDKDNVDIGHIQIHSRAGSIEDLFNREIANKLLKTEKVENLTAFEVPSKKGYTVITYHVEGK